MNKVILCGRLVRDPEVRYSQGSNSMAIAKFALAVDRKFKKDGEQNADFINCTAFGKVAEVIEKYVTKGTKIIVEGRWQTGSYKNKDGATVYTNDCMVENIEFCESKSSSNYSQSQSSNNNPAPNSDGFISIPNGIEDELPFS